jgi:hypothetical protein
MPGYSDKAQPYLNAIAHGIFASQEIRDWLIRGTPAERRYLGADVLIEEQKAVRGSPKQPFFCNYHCGRDSRCTCRIEGSKALESDAILFFRNILNHTLALHVEFKHKNETFGFGQPEAYPLRAACFAKTHRERRTLNAHDDWTTVIFCDEAALSDPRLSNFHRVITHAEAAKVFDPYPAIAASPFWE